MNYNKSETLRRSIYGQSENKHRKYRLKLFISILVIIIGCNYSLIFSGTSHANSNANGLPIKSGWNGYCLDDYRDKSSSATNKVDIWSCNNSSAQDWNVTMTQIRHQDTDCLNVVTVNYIDLEPCSDSPKEIWLRDNTGYLNPNTGMCLSEFENREGSTPTLESCKHIKTPSQSWSPASDYTSFKCPTSQAAAVACNAVKEWDNWQDNPNGHLGLLNKYTGNASYEEWCADFVSYVYKESGFPFTNGNYLSWDENDANQIENMGFTYHSADGYTPKAGDIAYFTYNNGHVEIVIAGGSHPTFVYGNSATNDPTTGNGEMATNTILSLPKLGHVEYYLSPNSST